MNKFALKLNKDFWRKVAALVAAIVLWVGVMSEQNPWVDEDFLVPVEVRHVQEGYFVEQETTEAVIKIRAPRSVIANMVKDDLAAYVDLSSTPVGQQGVDIRVTIPQGVELVGVLPHQCRLTLDQFIKKEMKVETANIGEMPQGIQVDAVEAAEKGAVVKGPSLLVGQVAKVVARVEVAERKADFADEVKLVAVNTEGKEVSGLSIVPEKTKITGKVVSVPVTKTVDVTLQMVGELSRDLAMKGITTEFDTIEISGYQPNVEKITSISAEPLSLSDITESTTRELNILLPDGITSKQTKMKVTINVVHKAR